MLKSLFRRTSLGARYVERFFDYKIYITSIFDGNITCKFHKNYEIDYSKDVVIVFYCGIGDFLYGVPILKEIKRRSKKKLIAYVGSVTNNFNNSSVADIAKSLNIFDEVVSYYPSKPNYWKNLDISYIVSNELNAGIYNFSYNVNNQESSRLKALSNQFDLKSHHFSLLNAINVDGYKPNEKVIHLLNKIQKTNKDTVFLHLDTRSGGYVYPYIVKLMHSLIKAGFNVLMFTPQIKANSKQESEMFDFILKSGSMFIMHQKAYIQDTLFAFNKLNPYTISVNSIFWPLTHICSSKTLAIHYIDSGDGHQFFHEQMFFLTSNKLSYKKIKKQILKNSSHKFNFIKKKRCLMSRICLPNSYDYDVDKKGYISYHPDLIMSLFMNYVVNDKIKS